MKSIALALLLSLTACVTVPETGRQAFIVTSEAEENQLGAQAYKEILSNEPISGNSRWNKILQRVGKRIADAANKPGFQWEFKLIESKEPNAFCLPGGKVAFYTGILPIAKNEAGLAAIMGHEVAHATARHGGQRMTRALGTQIGLAGLSALLGGDDKSTKKGLLMAALGVGASVGVMLPFSRGNEEEADKIGLIYMARAGYDPRAAPRLWGRMHKAAGGSSPPEFLSTHPPSLKRQKSLKAQLPQVMPIYQRSSKVGLGEAL